MARRSREYDEQFAAHVRDPEFVREHLTSVVDAGTPLKEALGRVIRAVGVKEFAQKVGMPSPNVLRGIDPRHNPTQETLERLLKPFGLKLGLAQLASPRRSRPAKSRPRRASKRRRK